MNTSIANQADQNIIGQLLMAARAKGMTQKTLATRAGVPEETLSRAKKRGSAHWSVLDALARTAGVRLGVLPAQSLSTTESSPTREQTFAEKYGVALAWSNSKTSTDVLIRRALLAPRFQMLLDAAVEFGPEKLFEEWAALKAESPTETQQVQPITERLLGHIHDGYQQASR